MKQPLPFEAEAIVAFATGMRRQLVELRPDDPRSVRLTDALMRLRAEWDQLRRRIPDLPVFDEATAGR